MLLKNDYGKFFLKGLILLIIICLLDFSIGHILRHFYFKQTTGESYFSSYAIDSTTADIIIFGSSRANHHYNPAIFEKSLKITCYNAGRDGNFIFYSYALFKSITQRHKPKIIIFEIKPEEMMYNISHYDRLSVLLPYYRSHPEIRNIIELKGPFEKIKLLSSIYPFNSNILSIVPSNNHSLKTKRDNNGYISLTNILKDTTLTTIKSEINNIDKIKIKFILDIINTCKKSAIQLIFIQSPIFAKIESSQISVLEKLLINQKVNYWNYTNNNMFHSSPQYFQDINHLNDQGATIFSQLIVKRIIEEKIN